MSHYIQIIGLAASLATAAPALAITTGHVPIPPPPADVPDVSADFTMSPGDCDADPTKCSGDNYVGSGDLKWFYRDGQLHVGNVENEHKTKHVWVHITHNSAGFSPPGDPNKPGEWPGLTADGGQNVTLEGASFTGDAMTGGNIWMQWAIRHQPSGETLDHRYLGLGEEWRYVTQIEFKAWCTPGVPEPASWAMLITGFGLVGAASRRKRAAESHAAA